ncbi:hypothetical protein [Actinomadura atramentaria]|uniref:hypothetical protein n=1 Tax=Actinomadura atramentaria TaxID=1990 RepID=UPI0003784E37|nr:hypothetical protein [Actinomadura atramentaria]
MASGGPGSSSDPHRRAAPWTGPPASYRRSYRCRTALDRGPDRLTRRYEDFVALHRELADEPEVDVRRVWWCGAALAVGIAALAGSAAFLLRGLLGVGVPAFLEPEAGPGAAGLTYGVCAGAATLQATALVHVLAGTADRPVRSFAWIGAIVVLLVTLLPLTLRGPLDAVLATAGLNLAGGTLIVALLTVSAAASRPWPEPRPRRRRRRRR